MAVGSGGQADRRTSTRLPQRSRRPDRLNVAVLVVGFVLTASSVWATKEIDESTEQHLLQGQTRQAAAVLTSAILLIQQPLGNALAAQPLPGETSRSFTRVMSKFVGPGKSFVGASIWRRDGDRMVRVDALGVPPAMPASSPSTQAYLRSALAKPTSTVKAVRVGQQRRIAYALADRGTGHVVYAERAIPANRRSPVDSDSAFADIHYAIYLGPHIKDAALTTTDLDPRDLPLEGTTATARAPFGDTVLTLVTAPRHHLGSSLSQRLPWVLLIVGSLLTAIALILSQVLVRRRQNAEASAAFAAGLSERLQRALLPLAIPKIPQLEVAVEYVAGARGVDIGGDWYSMIGLDGEQFAFVVGDVSGHGIDAVAVMARARFTLRAYLLRGDSPDAALNMAARQFDVSEDGHIVTAIVGVGNWRTGEITVANAGHCKPLRLSHGAASFVDVATGPPLGTGFKSYAPTTFTLDAGDTLFCYTDGLIERRTEDIDVGMDRLASTMAGTGTSVTDLVEHTVRSLRTEQAEDDIAVLAFRWEPRA